ncbi:hypothetical protein FFZ95_08895 [Leptospira borgpetersenii]|nr:hypothetical protein FFZ95_08895 [Leptospira borgpetersenii]TQE56660.1 hypothetical protein FFZ96_08980 [Leptospira borgpetersenii]
MTYKKYDFLIEKKPPNLPTTSLCDSWKQCCFSFPTDILNSVDSRISYSELPYVQESYFFMGAA